MLVVESVSVDVKGGVTAEGLKEAVTPEGRIEVLKEMEGRLVVVDPLVRMMLAV